MSAGFPNEANTYRIKTCVHCGILIILFAIYKTVITLRYFSVIQECKAWLYQNLIVRVFPKLHILFSSMLSVFINSTLFLGEHITFQRGGWPQSMQCFLLTEWKKKMKWIRGQEGKNTLERKLEFQKNLNVKKSTCGVVGWWHLH